MRYSTLNRRITAFGFGILGLAMNGAPALASEMENPSRCSARVGSCDYYECLANDLRCEPDGRLSSIAGPLCRDYEASADAFSEEGQLFLKEVRPCLQQEIEASRAPGCEGAESAFVDAHMTCYARHGFCSLPLLDQSLVASIATPAMGNLNLVFAGWDVLMSCGSWPSTLLIPAQHPVSAIGSPPSTVP